MGRTGIMKFATDLFEALRAAAWDGEGITRDSYGVSESMALDIIEKSARAAGLETERDEVLEPIREQLPDGSWPPPVTRRIPNQPDEVRSASPGLVAENAVRLLRFAALTGDSGAAGAGRRAADFLLPVRVPRVTRRGAPDLGANTREVLAEAGMAAAEIDALIAAKAIVQG